MRSMYVVVFDKSGKSLSGWHYNKLREFEAEWIQQSVVKMNDVKIALEFAEKLREFRVQKIRILRAVDITDKST